MKRKIQVTVKDQGGNTTFYGQGVVGPKGKVKIPVGAIMTGQLAKKLFAEINEHINW